MAGQSLGLRLEDFLPGNDGTRSAPWDTGRCSAMASHCPYQIMPGKIKAMERKSGFKQVKHDLRASVGFKLSNLNVPAAPYLF